MKTFGDWFGSQGWEPFDFQQEAWRAIERGHSGLVHAPTGFGKTYAVLGGLIGHWLSRSGSGSVGALGTPSGNRTDAEPLRVLWVTPMRALANDTLLSLARPIADMELPWTAELRHGDTSSHRKKKQRECFPTVLVTTPESLSLLLSYPDTRDKFQHLVAVASGNQAGCPDRAGPCAVANLAARFNDVGALRDPGQHNGSAGRADGARSGSCRAQAAAAEG